MLDAQHVGVVLQNVEVVRVQCLAVRVLQQDFLDLCPPVLREVEFVDVLGDLRLIEQAADGEFTGEAPGAVQPRTRAAVTSAATTMNFWVNFAS